VAEAEAAEVAGITVHHHQLQIMDTHHLEQTSHQVRNCLPVRNRRHMGGQVVAVAGVAGKDMGVHQRKNPQIPSNSLKPPSKTISIDYNKPTHHLPLNNDSFQ
jgi:hypothetical protein